MNDIDVVLLWVDGNDPEWQKEYSKYKQRVKDQDPLATSIARYQDWENLQYIFRGIEQFMPWVRKIHFITCGHKPSWLNVNHPKLHCHSHKDIFYNLDHLPTFNSNAIEFNLVGIPDLSEKFILFNDDTFVVQATEPERFFKNGIPVDFLALGFPHRGWLYNKLRKHTVFMDTMVNNICELNGNFRKKELLKKNKRFFYNQTYPWAFNFKNRIVNFISRNFEVMVINHQPQPHLKSTIFEVKSACKEIYDKTSASKFRDRNNITQYLFRFWNLAQGNFVPHYFTDHLLLDIKTRESLENNIEKIANKRFVCANDNLLTNSDFDYCKALLNPKLNEILPDKSSFES